MGQVKIKPGVTFEPFAPAGMRILEVLKSIVTSYSFDVTITSGTDGEHSGPADPHKHGMAFDIRTNDLNDAQRNLLLKDLQLGLGPKFHAFWESPGTPNAHIHVQRTYGTVYTIEDYLNNA